MKHEILFLEDNPEVARKAKLYMEEFAPESIVVEVSTLKDAMKALKSHPSTDILICDIMIGYCNDATLNYSGLQLIRSLKADQLHKDIPIITLTTSTGFDQEAIEAGADICLRMPFSLKELNCIVQSIFIREDLKKKRRPVFIAHVFTESEIDDLRRAISDAFKDTPFSPYYADVDIREGHILLDKIVENVRNTEFGIYDISLPNKPNVFLELGISMGLGKPYYLICKSGTEIPSDLAGLDRIEYSSFLQLTTHILNKIVTTKLSG